ncbi:MULTISPECIES: DUF202 domain-containing protein [unclassified Streptomyces]|uniref:DUF202 domain-containing protein n=1 Tax=unclassified Streptomyces TaxID=2593676 RepID=UPI002E2B7B75|nr:DUF202 domain-containing protein [Streptomyces sp. NBC_00223]
MTPAAPGGPTGSGGGSVVVETERDPGLQPERTRLAWRRTTLSWAVAAVLAGRQVLHRGGGVGAAVALCLAALVFLLFLRLAHLRITRLGAARPTMMSARVAAAVMACTVSLAILGAALVW